MTKNRKKIKPDVKRQIMGEAGNKCANPGCSNWRVHIHHIKHWAIYQSDDPSILIAVCPSCHDAIHHGSLEFTDEILYAWKGIERPTKPNTTHVYIEPSDNIKLLAGSIALATKNDGATIFELSANNKLSFRILDGDITLLNLNVSNLSGEEKLKVVDNHVRIHDTDALSFDQVPGHVRVISSEVRAFLSEEFIAIMRGQKADFVTNDEIVLLELQVIKPGLVKVCGCWADEKRAVVITDDSLSFIKPELKQPLSLVGEGEDSVFMYTGPVDCSLFGFKSENSGALKV
ncbi:HNH endonuclease signature motif containing protein [Vibrio splendidus]|uniref:HNH endonuclease signature motif containing protein n=1 Tax=Vibrio splendidus TaxID=29497 RepID=UPI0011471127|nr:HNH endonuclease signature motif containing protein [Vibrio splendidus]